MDSDTLQAQAYRSALSAARNREWDRLDGEYQAGRLAWIKSQMVGFEARPEIVAECTEAALACEEAMRMREVGGRAHASARAAGLL